MPGTGRVLRLGLTSPNEYKLGVSNNSCLCLLTVYSFTPSPLPTRLPVLIRISWLHNLTKKHIPTHSVSRVFHQKHHLKRNTDLGRTYPSDFPVVLRSNISCCGAKVAAFGVQHTCPLRRSLWKQSLSFTCRSQNALSGLNWKRDNDKFLNLYILHIDLFPISYSRRITNAHLQSSFQSPRKFSLAFKHIKLMIFPVVGARMAQRNPGEYSIHLGVPW